MSATKFQTLCESVLNRLFGASQAIVNAGEEHPPLLLAVSVKNEMAVIPVHAFDKDRMAGMHRGLAAETSQIAVAVLVVETWFYKSHANDPNNAKYTKAVATGAIEVADLPDRQEAILFNFRSGTEQRLALCQIDRQTNTLIKGELIDPADPKGKFSGRFVGDGQTRINEKGEPL